MDRECYFFLSDGVQKCLSFLDLGVGENMIAVIGHKTKVKPLEFILFLVSVAH